MLQQTTVAAVVPYFMRFVARFPSVDALAAAGQDDVLQAWAGLGYYARARNMHRCAQIVAAAGQFPRDVAGLRALPGIGSYTAAAVASIAFGVPALAVDGNVERVASRVFAIERPLPAARAEIAAAARTLAGDPAATARPADFTQALFDLGATVCVPRAPLCERCPWVEGCAGHAVGLAAQLPRKSPKRLRPIRYGAQFWLEDATGTVLLRRRPQTGLLGGMLELPGTPWREEPWTAEEARAHAPQAASWRLVGHAKHGFTHFEVKLMVFCASVPVIDAEGLFRSKERLAAEALPTVMRRCVQIVQENSAAFTLR